VAVRLHLLTGLRRLVEHGQLGCLHDRLRQQVLAEQVEVVLGVVGAFEHVRDRVAVELLDVEEERLERRALHGRLRRIGHGSPRSRACVPERYGP